MAQSALGWPDAWCSAVLVLTPLTSTLDVNPARLHGLLSHDPTVQRLTAGPADLDAQPTCPIKPAADPSCVHQCTARGPRALPFGQRSPAVRSPRSKGENRRCALAFSDLIYQHAYPRSSPSASLSHWYSLLTTYTCRPTPQRAYAQVSLTVFPRRRPPRHSTLLLHKAPVHACLSLVDG